MTEVLIICAHPDDDVIGMGGTIRYHLELGNRVRVVYLTDGGRGIPGRQPTETAAIRQSEALHASGELQGGGVPGILSLEFWDQPDGELRVTEELIERVRELADSLAEPVVYTHHDQDAHADHRATAEIVRHALSRIHPRPPACWMFEVWTPLQRVDRCHHLSEDQRYFKVEAIGAHQSQVQLTDFTDAALSLNRYRAIMHGHGHGEAEAFQRLRYTGEPMRIAVCLFTWSPSLDHPRSLYAQTTLQAAVEGLDPGIGNELLWHIADDGSGPGHVEKLLEILNRRGISPTMTDAQRGGYGRSYNLATQHLHQVADFVLCLEDDWQLQRRLDLGPILQAMTETHSNEEPIGCVRMGYLGWTGRLDCHLIERAGQKFLYFDASSTEPHIFAGHPRLEAVWWQRAVGTWPEGLAAGATEFEVAHRPAARTGIVWPLDLTRTWGDLFPHIGSEGVGSVMPAASA